jgi:hypothetical protein
MTRAEASPSALDPTTGSCDPVSGYTRRPMKSPAMLARYPVALLVLGVTGVPACGPTGTGNVQCGQVDITNNGQNETCASQAGCPGTDVCFGGYCIGSMCPAGTCKPDDAGPYPYVCVTGSVDSGRSMDAASGE